MMSISQPPAMERALSDVEIGGISQYTRQSGIILIKSGGVYEVPVKLNGVLDIYLVFDSGAAETSITPDVFFTLLRTGTIEQKDWLLGRYYQLADGSRVRSNRFRMKFIKIGNRTIKDINCVISNSIKAPMLLGQSALEQLGEYTFDYKNGVLILK